MIILLVDQTAEGQTKLAKIFDEFDPVDRDALDIQLILANANDFAAKVNQCDVLILGPELGLESHRIAKQAKELDPTLEVILYVGSCSYSGEFFRQAHIARARKVIPVGAPSLDLLQELVAIHAQFKIAGRTKKGKLVVVAQVKGGLGASTLVAALGEISNRDTLLWDFDVESKDLSRALCVRSSQSKSFSSLIQGTKELTRDSLRECCVGIGNSVWVLPPPQDIAAGMDLIGHPDSIKLVHRITELARIVFDYTIVDISGKLTPSTGTLLRLADEVVVLTDDSLLGLSAAHEYFEMLLAIMKGNASALKVVCAGAKLPSQEVNKILKEYISLPDISWNLPCIPVDTAASKWAGSGKTLYSLGSKGTKKNLEDISNSLGLMEQTTQKKKQTTSEPVGWVRNVLQFAANI